MKRKVILLLAVLLVFHSTTSLVVRSYAKSAGKKIFIYGEDTWSYSTLANLLRGEDFDVTYEDTLPLDPALLDPYDAFICVKSVPDYLGIPSEIEDRVKNGSGLFIMSIDSTDLALAGVVPYGYMNDDTTSRFPNHTINDTIMKGVHSIHYIGVPLNCVSSDAYPLVLGNNEVWGIIDPVLMVANTLGEGNVTAAGSWLIGSNQGIVDEDNALLIKNIVYWLSGEEVPLFPPIPSLMDIEDEIAKLRYNLTLLSQQLDTLRMNLSNTPEFISLNQQLSDLNTTLTQLEKENATLKQQLSQLQIWLYVVIGLVILALVVPFIRKAKGPRSTT